MTENARERAGVRVGASPWVADDGVADRGHVRAQLVRAPGDRRQRDEAAVRAAGHAPAIAGQSIASHMRLDPPAKIAHCDAAATPAARIILDVLGATSPCADPDASGRSAACMPSRW